MSNRQRRIQDDRRSTAALENWRAHLVQVKRRDGKHSKLSVNNYCNSSTNMDHMYRLTCRFRGVMWKCLEPKWGSNSSANTFLNTDSTCSNNTCTELSHSSTLKYWFDRINRSRHGYLSLISFRSHPVSVHQSNVLARVIESWWLVGLHQLTPTEEVSQVELPRSSFLAPFSLYRHLGHKLGGERGEGLNLKTDVACVHEWINVYINVWIYDWIHEKRNLIYLIGLK